MKASKILKLRGENGLNPELPKSEGKAYTFLPTTPTKPKPVEKPKFEISEPQSTAPQSFLLKHIGELPDYPCLAIDTETTGLERDAKLLGVSFCSEAGKTQREAWRSVGSPTSDKAVRGP